MRPAIRFVKGQTTTCSAFLLGQAQDVDLYCNAPPEAPPHMEERDLTSGLADAQWGAWEELRATQQFPKLIR